MVACLNWRDRLLTGGSMVPDVAVDEDEADRAVRIFNRLRLPDVVGRPPLSEAGGDWFRSIVRAVFGSYDPATGRRGIQEVFILVPKKNGKSSYSAAVMVTAMLLNDRPNADLLLIAPTKEIADISFGQARGMIVGDDILKQKFARPQDHIRTIRYLPTDSRLKVVAADVDAVTGVKATYTLIDETHVFSTKSNASHVFTELRGALASRPDGFLWQISTQSKSPPAGVFKAELAKARRVRDGKVDLPLLPILYELPIDLAENGGWMQPDMLRAVNPNIGRSVSMDFINREIETAESEGPEAAALFASQHANVEIGVALQSDRWAGADFWSRNGDRSLRTVDELLERSEVVVAGYDGGGLDDLSGLALLGREKQTRNWLLWAHAWCHRIVLDRRKLIASRLLDFRSSGELTIVDDDLGDIEEIVAIISAVRDRGKLSTVAVDPAGLGELIDHLALAEMTPENGLVIGAKQGIALMNAIKGVERKLANGTFRHSGSRLMEWCVGNLKIEPTATAIRATKVHAGDAKIDPIMATFNAAAVMSMNPAAQGEPDVFFF